MCDRCVVVRIFFQPYYKNFKGQKKTCSFMFGSGNVCVRENEAMELEVGIGNQLPVGLYYYLHGDWKLTLVCFGFVLKSG
jgi:hypothetical protein